MKFKTAAALLCTAAIAASSAAAIPASVFNTGFAENVSLSEAQSPVITEAAGGLESAYVQWTNTAQADGYNVYVKGGDFGEYTKIDDELVRYYGSYYRADVLGLKPGSYTIKVAAVSDGQETAVETSQLEVKSHIREGFAFSENSPNAGKAPGGYNDDGSVPEDANIIYVTAENAKTVKATVYENGKPHECTGLEEILQYLAKNKDPRHHIIRIIGTVTREDVDVAGDYALNSNGYLVLKGCSNVTLEGVGNDATLKNIGILIRNSQSVEVRNLGLMLFADDGISIDTDNTNTWVHNNDVFYGMPGKDADQVKGDGSIDCKLSKYVTISENHFWDSGKAALVDAAPTLDYDSQSDYITYHHNWFDHSDSRHPRIRHATVHIYNNYFDGNSKYGTGVTSGASAFVEKNVYRNCNHPFYSSEQGSEGGNSLSNEAGGIIKAFDNHIDGGEEIIYASAENKNDFDAYLASSRDEKISSDYTTKLSTFKGETYPNTYDNFDTDPAVMYDYTPEETSTVVDTVTTYAGRGKDADFKYTFNNEEADESHDIDQNLKDMLLAYESSLMSSYTGASGEVYPATGADVTPPPKPTSPAAPTNSPIPTQDPQQTQDPQLALIPVTEKTVWTFEDAADEYTSVAVLNNAKIYADATNNVRTDKPKFDTQYTKILKLKGSAKPGQYSTVGIIPGKTGTVEVRFENTNATSERYMCAFDENGNEIANQPTIGAAATLTVRVTDEYVNKEMQFGSRSSGLSLCSITFTPDGAPEASPETSPEASPEASPETSPEASPEASPETSPEASPEASPETSPEASPEASPETSPEASPETSPEASPTSQPEYNYTITSGVVIGRNITAEYESSEEEAGAVWYIAQFDDNGRLVGVSSGSITEESGEFSAERISGAARAAAYIWNAQEEPQALMRNIPIKTGVVEQPVS